MRRRRSGQAAAETMMLAFIVSVALVAMYHLFTVTWATQNAHMRAREAVLHGDAYLRGARTSYVESSDVPFDSSSAVMNYRKAEPGRPLRFEARAWDTTRDDMIGSDAVEVFARITE